MKEATKPEAFKGERGNVYKFNLKENPALVVAVEGFNVRQDFGDLEWLKESIIRDGLKVPAQGYYKEGRWHLTDGERRFRAAMLAVNEGHDVIFKIEAEPKGYTDADRLVDMLTRNSGEPLKMMEEAELYRRLSKLNFDEHEIAAKTGKSVQHVRNIWKLLEAEPEVLEMVEKGSVAASTVIEMQKDLPASEVAANIKEALETTGKAKVTAKDIKGAKQFGEKKKKVGDAVLVHEGENLQSKEAVGGLINELTTPNQRQTASDGYKKVMEQAKDLKDYQKNTLSNIQQMGRANRETDPVPPGSFPIAQTVVTLNKEGGVESEEPLIPSHEYLRDNPEEAEEMFFKITAPQTSQVAAQWIETVLRLLEEDVAKTNESDVMNRVGLIEMLRDVAKGDTPFRTFAEQILS